MVTTQAFSQKSCLVFAEGEYEFSWSSFFKACDAKYTRFAHRILVLLLVLGLLTAGLGCSQKGLVTEKYSRDFYHVPKLLPDGPIDKNPRFIIYGDSRPGSRFREKFLERENWFTWKMLVVPFYEVYWLGNGVVGGINRLRHTPSYGVRERRMVRDAVYEEGKRSNVDFIIHGGDIPYDGQRPSHWATFLKENKVERPLVLDFPLLPVVGNHERANDPVHGLPNYQAIFDYPQFYVLDFPDAAIFVVDSDVILDQYQFIEDDKQDALFQEWFVSENPEQPAWLERELASREQSFKILVMHHPPISFGTHHSDWYSTAWGRDLQQKRQKLIGLLYQQGVQVVLCSHEHLYEHSILRYSPDEDIAGGEIHFIISGGGGVPLRSCSGAERLERYLQNYSAEGLDVLLVKQERIYHYCLVDVDPGKVTIRVMEVTGDRKEPQRVIDEISISSSRHDQLLP